MEVCVNGRWGTVCDHNRNQNAFDLICRQYFNSTQCKQPINKPLLSVSCEVETTVFLQLTH